MYCSSCGDELTEKDAKCPYCGSINPLGAEAEYMEKLEYLREDTESLGNKAPLEYERQLKHHGNFALKIFAIVLFVCIMVFLLIIGSRRYFEYSDKKNMREEIAFQKEYFPMLDELYAKGDDRKTSMYLSELYEKNGSSALFHWSHYTYFYYFDLYQSVTDLHENMKNNDFSDVDVVYGFYSALLLTQQGIQDFDSRSLSSEETDKIIAFQKEAEKLLTQDLHLPEDELEQIYDSCCQDDFLSYKLCRKYLESIQFIE